MRAHIRPIAALVALATLSILSTRAHALVGIRTSPNSDRLALCGLVDLAKADARLKADPVGFYLDTSKVANRQFVVHGDAMVPAVCLTADKFEGSDWQIAGYGRRGPFNVFGVSFDGYKTDASGKRITDRTEMRYLEIFANPQWNSDDADRMARAFYELWHSRAAGGEIDFGDYAEGYPHSVLVSTRDHGFYFTARMSLKNSHDCRFESGVGCTIFGDREQSTFRVSPRPKLEKQLVNYYNSRDKRVDFDPLTDSFRAYDPGLKAMLEQIGFQPAYWLLSRDSEIDFVF